MLLRCRSLPPEVGRVVSDGDSTPLHSVTVGKVYRPLGLVGKTSARYTGEPSHAVIRTDLDVGGAPVVHLVSLEHFDVVEGHLETDWSFTVDSSALRWQLGSLLARNLEDLQERIAQGDPQTWADVSRRTTP